MAQGNSIPFKLVLNCVLHKKLFETLFELQNKFQTADGADTATRQLAASGHFNEGGAAEGKLFEPQQ